MKKECILAADWEEYRFNCWASAAEKYKKGFEDPSAETPKEEAKRLGNYGVFYKKDTVLIVR